MIFLLFSTGMWSHTMTVQDYQDLIDRGWRRLVACSYFTQSMQSLLIYVWTFRIFLFT